MPGKRLVIPFFTDQNVPDSVGNTLVKAGHRLTRLRDVMDPTTKDPIIAVACARHGQVLVTHDTDFKGIARRLQITQRQYRNTLHRIQLCCPEPESAGRVAALLPLIESEWRLIEPDRSMVIGIRSRSVVLHR